LSQHRGEHRIEVIPDAVRERWQIVDELPIARLHPLSKANLPVQFCMRCIALASRQRDKLGLGDAAEAASFYKRSPSGIAIAAKSN